MNKIDAKYKEWKARVNVRDNFTCKECGKPGNETHHIKRWKDYPELRFDVDNGKTLCLDCHRKYKSGGRPKIKEGKHATFYLSFEAIDRIRNQAYALKKSMSQYIEDLAKEKDVKN